MDRAEAYVGKCNSVAHFVDHMFWETSIVAIAFWKSMFHHKRPTFISTTRFRVKAHRTVPRGDEGLVIDASVNNSVVKERYLSRAF